MEGECNNILDISVVLAGFGCIINPVTFSGITIVP
jgi:hypothetical protein